LLFAGRARAEDSKDHLYDATVSTAFDVIVLDDLSAFLSLRPASCFRCGTNGSTRSLCSLLIRLSHASAMVIASDLRPLFPPVFGRVLGFQSGLMRPVFPERFSLRTHWA
jgi:hypothetical protein